MGDVMRPLVAGNWKMNGLASSLKELGALKAALAAQPARLRGAGLPALHPDRASRLGASKGAFALGGQDCHAKPSGAHTGDIAAEMLKDAGAAYVIVGHSERRQYHGERDADVAAKAEAAWRAGLTAIICIGETEDQRYAGDAHHVCDAPDRGQRAGRPPPPPTQSIAYEPVWAIGTGRTPTADEIAQMHAHIRAMLVAAVGRTAPREMRILYGGSVKPDNAARNS